MLSNFDQKLSLAEARLASLNFVTTNEILLELQWGPIAKVAIDSQNYMIAFLHTGFTSMDIVHFGELISCEVVYDSDQKAKNSTINAVVGGVLFGPAGAFIGHKASKKEKFLSDLSIKITTTNINSPLIKLTFLRNEVKQGSSQGKKLIAYCERVNATVNSIIHNNRINPYPLHSNQVALPLMNEPFSNAPLPPGYSSGQSPQAPTNQVNQQYPGRYPDQSHPTPPQHQPYTQTPQAYQTNTAPYSTPPQSPQYGVPPQANGGQQPPSQAETPRSYEPPSWLNRMNPQTQNGATPPHYPPLESNSNNWQTNQAPPFQSAPQPADNNQAGNTGAPRPFVPPTPTVWRPLSARQDGQSAQSPIPPAPNQQFTAPQPLGSRQYPSGQPPYPPPGYPDPDPSELTNGEGN